MMIIARANWWACKISGWIQLNLRRKRLNIFKIIMSLL